MDGRKLLKIIIDALALGVLILFLLIVVMYLSACGKTKAPKQYEERLVYAGSSGITLEVWIDTETGICYLVRSGGGLEVMVDHEGKPFIANGWRDYSGSDG